jgi:hypothetical protein
VQCGTLEHFEELLQLGDTWFLVDAMEPMTCIAKTVMVCSPNRNIYQYVPHGLHVSDAKFNNLDVVSMQPLCQP